MGPIRATSANLLQVDVTCVTQQKAVRYTGAGEPSALAACSFTLQRGCASRWPVACGDECGSLPHFSVFDFGGCSGYARANRPAIPTAWLGTM